MRDSPKIDGANVLSRALDLLRLLTTESDRTSLTSYAASLDIPPSTAYRLVAVLVDRGLIARAGRGRYVRGGALADLAGQPLPHHDLKAIARNPVERLVRETKITAHMGIWDQDMVQYLLRVAPPGAALFTREGERLEGYCSAIGKTLLAHMTDTEQEAYLAAGTFVALTPYTLTDPQHLHDEFRAIRAMGVAFDRQEMKEGLECIAVPVRRRDGRVIAALSLSGSSGVASAENSLRHCAEAISDRLG